MTDDASFTSMDQTDQESLNREDEQEQERRSQRLVLPEDGYEWKKYGQKFIRNIGKFRSYFKCQRENCRAKKKAEWSSTESDELTIKYEGVHTHGSLTDQNSTSAGSSSTNANQYDLLTQVSRRSSSSSTTTTSHTPAST